jgi:hypothetical protein
MRARGVLTRAGARTRTARGRELAELTQSYFLTWGWMETWLAMLPPGEAPELAVIREGERPVACAFLGRHRQLRHGVLPSRQRHLNTTGTARFDELCIEHNAIVGVATLATLLELLPCDWDELLLPGVQREMLANAKEHPRWRWSVDRESVAAYVDLDRVRAADYTSLLGSSTRAQLRRARRHAGAFADPWFTAFHRRLIADRLASSAIELLRIRAGARVIGCLYNFVWRGRVTFYQSGLAAPDAPHDKPG